VRRKKKRIIIVILVIVKTAAVGFPKTAYELTGRVQDD
jgi:hypothetical protein